MAYGELKSQDFLRSKAFLELSLIIVEFLIAQVSLWQEANDGSTVILVYCTLLNVYVCKFKINTSMKLSNCAFIHEAFTIQHYYVVMHASGVNGDAGLIIEWFYHPDLAIHCPLKLIYFMILLRYAVSISSSCPRDS